MRHVLVIIHADSEGSCRVAEGLRMSVGMALAGNDVEVVLQGAAASLIDAPDRGLPGARRAREFLGALRELGGAARPGNFSLAEARKANVVIRWGE